MLKLGESKKEMLATLKHFDVNYIPHYTPQEFMVLVENNAVSKDKRYGIRCIEGAGGSFSYNLPLNLVVKKVNQMKNPENYLICESMFEHDRNNFVCNGEVRVEKKQYCVYEYDGFINKTKGISVREASKLTYPDTIIIKNYRQVPDILFNLLWEKKLIGYVVEFTLYTVPVGIKNNPLLVWEIRKTY